MKDIEIWIEMKSNMVVKKNENQWLFPEYYHIDLIAI